MFLEDSKHFNAQGPSLKYKADLYIIFSYSEKWVYFKHGILGARYQIPGRNILNLKCC
jgi:hypothetical protein